MAAAKPKRKRDTKVSDQKGSTKAAATRAVERAKTKGAVGPNGTDSQRAIRDGAIIASLAAGHTQAEVAAELGVTTRTVQRVKASATKRPSILEKLPMQIVERLLASACERIADFSAMAYHHADSNPNAAIGAMKGAAQAEERLIELLLALGVLPDNLQLFRAESVLNAMAERMGEVMAQLNRGEITIEQAVDAFKKLTEETEHRDRERLTAG